MVDVEKDKTKGEEVHEEIQRIRYVPAHALFAAVLLIFPRRNFALFFRFLTHTLYRMTLRSRETKSLESACAEIVARAKNQGYETKGPVRIPTKILRITTRKSPCGEGSKTWDRFEMRIHKRVIDIHCPSSVVKEITNFRIDAGVDVNLVVWKQ